MVKTWGARRGEVIDRHIIIYTGVHDNSDRENRTLHPVLYGLPDKIERYMIPHRRPRSDMTHKITTSIPSATIYRYAASRKTPSRTYPEKSCGSHARGRPRHRDQGGTRAQGTQNIPAQKPGGAADRNMKLVGSWRADSFRRRNRRCAP